MMREILGLGCPWCSQRSLWMVSHPQREPFSPPAKHEELAKKGPENISTLQKHTPKPQKNTYMKSKKTQRVPTWFPHGSRMFPTLLPGAAAQSLADARRKWKWAGHESGLQSAPGAGPQLSHEKHGTSWGQNMLGI